MRILIVTNTYPPAEITGVGALAYELARALEEDGHEATVLTRKPADDPWVVATGGPKLLFPLAAALRFLRLARRGGFDLVHVHESDGAGVALLLRLSRSFRRLLRRPAGRPRLVATLQVSYRRERLAVRPVKDGDRIVSRPTAAERRFRRLRAPLLSFLGRLTARLADAVVAPSRVTARELEEDYGAEVREVIHNGVPETTVAEGAAAAAADSDESPRGGRILYAGRLRTRKAVAVLIEAFARLRDRFPEAELVLAGDGEQREALEARVARLGLDGAVRFPGSVPRNEMFGRYADADVFCLPSIYEGFPVAILEAMAAGLPVVASAVSGIPEGLEGGGGVVVPAEDSEALADALEKLLADPGERRRLGEEARRAVAERFAIDRIRGRYLELWRDLCYSDSD